MSDAPDLRDLTHAELERFVADLGEERYRADQLFRWLHMRGASSFDQMTDMSRDLREHLADRAFISSLELLDRQTSGDGSAKLAFQTADGHVVESVLMPEEHKVSVCLSTQAGCGLGCQFCATGRLGLKRSLRAAEIAGQLYAIRTLMQEQGDDRRLSNLVYMGMGEPLQNVGETLRSLEMLMHPLGADFSSRRITLSTAGVIPGLKRLAEAPVQVNLAVSLNATTQETRQQLMPIARTYPLNQLLDALRAFPLEKRRRITFEYVLISGVNDTDEDARRLPQLVAGIPCKFNVIPFNPIPDCHFEPPTPQRLDAFCERVRRAGYTVLRRTSRGDDIRAACGQLAGRPTLRDKK